MDEEAVKTADGCEKHSVWKHFEAELREAGYSWDKGSSGEEDSDGDLLGQAVVAGVGVNEQQPGEEKRAQDCVEFQRVRQKVSKQCA
jgi:hypothetical protein